MKESTIFRVIKFVAEKELNATTFTGEDLENEIGLEFKVLVHRYAQRVLTRDRVYEGIFESEDGTPLEHSFDASKNYRITYPAMMHWLEYVELKEARASSLTAQKNATTSIRIAIGAIAVSSVFAAIQLFFC